MSHGEAVGSFGVGGVEEVFTNFAKFNCPSGSVCIDEEGGVCVVTCSVDADCAGFGRGFACDSEGRFNGGEAPICRVP